MDNLPALPILEVPSLLISPSLTHIYDLPEQLIVNILRRLYSDHLARSRVVSKTFSKISTEVRSVNLLCSLDRYTNSGRLITPYKTIVTDLILSMGVVDSISIGVEERANRKSLKKKLDDLYLTEVSFVYPWLMRVCGRLTSLSISDYPMHSRRKWSEVLSLISFHCKNLHELVLKNAWLSTNGLSSAMLMLTSLTLEFVKLDDEDLDKVNSCCPSLQILNLILVEGLKNPHIDLLHLRTCQYVGSSLATTTPLEVIRAPDLTRIEVGFGRQIAYTTHTIKILQRKHNSCTRIAFVPASDFAKIKEAFIPFDKNTWFGAPKKTYLDSVFEKTFTNHPTLLRIEVIFIPVQGWSYPKASTLDIQKNPNFRGTQLFLPFEVE